MQAKVVALPWPSGDESDVSSASELAAIGTQETVFPVMEMSGMLKALVKLAEIGTLEIVDSCMLIVILD